MRRLPALLAAAGLLCCRCAPALASTRALRSASAAAAAQREAYVTFVASEDYVLGARVLGQSLRESGTTRCVCALRASAAATYRSVTGPACLEAPPRRIRAPLPAPCADTLRAHAPLRVRRHAAR